MIDKPHKLPATGQVYFWDIWQRQSVIQRYIALLMGVIVTGAILTLRGVGAFQVWELHTFDWMMNHRLAEPLDDRIVIVGINEQDVVDAHNASVSDLLMADLIEAVKAQKPTVIGLDFFRNVPRDEGYERLETIFQETPNLIGVEKVVDDVALSAVSGNSILVKNGRVAASDLIVDVDGRVRRGFLFPNTSGDRILESLAFRLSLEYLKTHDIEPNPSSEVLELGYARLPPFEKNSGGYSNADAGGYQIVINWRANLQMQTFSAQDVLTGKIPPDAMNGKIVLIGSMQSGDADVFFTPYSRKRGLPGLLPSHGVEIHASLVSEIISAALGQRPAIKILSGYMEIALMMASAWLGISLYRLGRNDFHCMSLFGTCLVSIAGASYLALVLWGWWLPVVPVSLSVVAAPLMTRLQKTNRLQALSQIDELTQLANRRRFQEHLHQEWQRAVRSHTPLSLIMCDVDYFKLYNDTYGHPEGDECLRQVAKAIGQTVRRPDDLAARYGGEEFVILLPNTTSEGAQQVAREAAANVKALALKHESSKVSDFVTISLGVTTLKPTRSLSPSLLVDTADLGLYEAKRRGRNQMVLRLPWTV